MSIYCYLACQSCREILFVKDLDTAVHADPVVHGQFLEKHNLHDLVYVTEDDTVMIGGEWKCPADDWKRFAPPTAGEWSCGKFIQDGTDP